MKIYLVGGAVRDQLLGQPIKEKDWVVVGSTPEHLISQGFQQVGRDFPVFLHPQTKEEYALARTERKSGSGYHGFVCHYESKITLEEDLLRRDLTINAMARDEHGVLIDPYNGLYDLEHKLLRHVSPAFVEDPLRVLRVARFAARYHHLGFKLAEETRLLMYKMVKQGELHHLVAERIWQEWQKSLEEKNPEQFIRILRSCGALNIVLPELNNLFGVPNTAIYHPEIDSGEHTLLVLQEAVVLTSDPIIRFAATVHDLGKAMTPHELWPKHFDHGIRGVNVIETLCKRIKIPGDYRKLATLVSKEHLLIHRAFSLSPKTILDVLERCDAFRRPQLFDKLLISCEADAQGKGKKIQYGQRQFWQRILDICTKINAQSFIEQGHQGNEIKVALHEARLLSIKEFITQCG